MGSDIISTLPQSIIENILTLMPIKDATKTSILSKKWRYCWTTMPILGFNEYMVKVEASNSNELKKYKLVNAILQVLFLHKGLELQFNYHGEMGFQFDKIMLYLSSCKKFVKVFTAENISNNRYKLPSSFFLMQGLQELGLLNCNFEPPSTFNGFSKLKHLYLHYVEITSKSLRHLLSNCPLLEHLFLCGEYNFEDFAEENKFTFVELLECVPLIRSLDISQHHMKYLAMGGMPQELPTSLVHLKSLLLDVCLANNDEISSAFCLMRNSPNLEEINFTMCEVLHDGHIFINQLDFQDYSAGFNLDHLKEFTVSCYTHTALQFEFVKFVLAKSPTLRKAYIRLDANVSLHKEANILRDMIRLPFARASSSAALIVAHPPRP